MPRRDITHLALEARHLHYLQHLLRKHVPNAEVWAYGSRVRGGWHEGSDLDLVLRNRADLSQSLDGVADLREALSNSTLPLLVDVLDWAQIPEAMRTNILTNYVVVT